MQNLYLKREIEELKRDGMKRFCFRVGKPIIPECLNNLRKLKGEKRTG